jgi:nucleotide-binding universal stress UspA family protein
VVTLLWKSDDRLEDFVLHPTDLSEASERAFHHALAIALRQSAQFTLLHAIGRRSTDNWADFPSVREKVAQWRAAGTLDGLEDRARQTSISKIEVDIRDPVAATLQFIARHPVDMLVLATQGRSGLSRLIRPSRAERLAREAKLHTLFVPHDGRPFVDGESGEVSLRKILVPVDPAIDPRAAMVRAVRFAALLDDPTLEITLLHVGDGEDTTMEDVPDLPFCRWSFVRRAGDVVENILGVAEEIRADAIYMATAWTKGGFGRGDHGVTERVLAGALCPVVAVPVDETHRTG